MSDSALTEVECVIVGAGVVGLAVARALQLKGLQSFIIEANSQFGMETSSRNSEVIHAGIYYPAGSLKAQLCVEGRKQLYAYCVEKNLPHRRTGKLIVATNYGEVPTLQNYLSDAIANGVDDLRWVEADELIRLEPAVSAVRGLYSPSTGIIDSHAYMQMLLSDFEAAGGHLVRGTRVVQGAIESQSIYLEDDKGDRYRTRFLINSAGLCAPDFATQLSGFPIEKIPPAGFAIGHYYILQGKSPFQRLIYPVAMPGGLGVHVTLDIDGNARFGPDVRWINSPDYSFDDSQRPQFAEAIRRYYPALDETRLQAGYTGIRPKISGPGEPAADFIIQGKEVHGISGLVNLFGIESPGLTSSLAIAERVANVLTR